MTSLFQTFSLKVTPNISEGIRRNYMFNNVQHRYGSDDVIKNDGRELAKYRCTFGEIYLLRMSRFRASCRH